MLKDFTPFEGPSTFIEVHVFDQSTVYISDPPNNQAGTMEYVIGYRTVNTAPRERQEMVAGLMMKEGFKMFPAESEKSVTFYPPHRISKIILIEAEESVKTKHIGKFRKVFRVVR